MSFRLNGYANVALIANHSYSKFLEQFRSEKVTVFADADITFGDVKDYIKQKEHLFSGDVLWLAFSGCYSLLCPPSILLSCKQNNCIDILHGHVMDSDCRSLPEAKNVLGEMKGLMQNLITEIRESIRPSSDFYMMPPIPCPVLSDSFVPHFKLHNLARVERYSIILDSSDVDVFKYLYSLFCKEIGLLLVKSYPQNCHKSYVEFLQYYLFVDDLERVHPVVDPNIEGSFEESYKENIMKLFNNCIEYTPQLIAPNLVNLDMVLFIGADKVLNQLSSLLPPIYSVFNAKYPFNWQEMRDGMSFYKSKYQKMFIIIVADFTMITNELFDEHCLSCSSALTYITMQQQPPDELIRTNIMQVYELRNELCKFFENENCVAVSPIFPRPAVKRLNRYSLPYHNALHGIYNHRTSPLLIDDRCFSCDDSALRLVKMWHDAFIKNSRHGNKLDVEFTECNPILWNNANERSLNMELPEVEKWTSYVKKLVNSYLSNYTELSVSGPIVQNQSYGLIKDNYTGNNTVDTGKFNPIPTITKNVSQTIDIYTSVGIDVEENVTDIKKETKLHIVGTSNYLKVLSNLKSEIVVRFIDKQYNKESKLNCEDLTKEFQSMSDNNIALIIFDLQYITKEITAKECKQMQCPEKHIALTMAPKNHIDAPPGSNYLIDTYIKELEHFLLVCNRKFCALPLPIPPSQIFCCFSGLYQNNKHSEFEWVYNQAHFGVGNPSNWMEYLYTFSSKWNNLAWTFYKNYPDALKVIRDYNFKNRKAFHISSEVTSFTGDITAYQAWLEMVKKVVQEIIAKPVDVKPIEKRYSPKRSVPPNEKRYSPKKDILPHSSGFSSQDKRERKMDRSSKMKEEFSRLGNNTDQKMKGSDLIMELHDILMKKPSSNTQSNDKFSSITPQSIHNTSNSIPVMSHTRTGFNQASNNLRDFNERVLSGINPSAPNEQNNTVSAVSGINNFGNLNQSQFQSSNQLNLQGNFATQDQFNRQSDFGKRDDFNKLNQSSAQRNLGMQDKCNDKASRKFRQGSTLSQINTGPQPEKVLVEVIGFSARVPTKLIQDFAMDLSRTVKLVKESSEFMTFRFPREMGRLFAYRLSNIRIGDSYMTTVYMDEDMQPLDLHAETLTMQQLSNVDKTFRKVHEKWYFAVANAMEKDVNEGLNLATFKTVRCLNNSCRNVDDCVNYHSTGDKRRNPLVSNYSHKMCYQIAKKKALGCQKGQGCPDSHNIYEQMFHPVNFQTLLCLANGKGLECSKYLLCKFAHSDSPQLFFTSHWDDIIVDDLKNSFKYLVGAIKASLKTKSPQDTKIFFISPNKEYINVVKMACKTIVKDYNFEFALLSSSTPSTDTASIFLGTPTTMINATNLSGHIMKASVLIVDDVQTIFKNDKDTEYMHSLFQRFKCNQSNFSKLQKVFVIKDYDKKAAGTISRFFGVELKPCLEKSKLQRENSKKSATPIIGVIKTKSEVDKPVTPINEPAKGNFTQTQQKRKVSTDKVESLKKLKKESDPKNNKSPEPDHFAAMKNKLLQEHEEEMKVFKDLPEIHSHYESRYQKFLSEYFNAFGRNHSDEHKSMKWVSYWHKYLDSINSDVLEEKLTSLKEKLGINKKENIANIQVSSSTASTSEPPKSKSPDDVIIIETKEDKKQDEEKSSSGDDEFSLSKALDLLEELKDRFGILAHSVQELINRSRNEVKNGKNGFLIFVDEESSQLCTMMVEKLKTLKNSSRFTAPIYEMAIKWMEEIMKRGKEKDNTEPNVEAIAAATMGKGPNFTLNMIKNELANSGKVNPPKDLINKLYLEVCSIHFNMTMK